MCRVRRLPTYMVALLRTHGAPPLWCNGLASFWLSVAQGCSHARALSAKACRWAWGEWKCARGERVQRRSRLRPVMTAGEPTDMAARPIHVTETLVADVPWVRFRSTADADRAVTELYSDSLPLAGAPRGAAGARYRNRGGSSAGLVCRHAWRLAPAAGQREGALLPAAVGGESITFRPQTPGRRGPQRAETPAGYAQRRARRDCAARAFGGGRRAADAAAAGSARRWCCGSTATCPRRRSPRRWESAGAPSRATPPGPCRHCAPCWSVRHEHA